MLHKSVFVVDDDDSLRRSLERLLRSEGYDVETFRSAEDFLASDFPNPCCLVLDVYLPGIDGVDLQHQLAGTARELPVVAISARSEEATRQRALDAGAAAFLVKPFKPSALLDAIERATARATMPKGNADDNHGADSLD